MPRIGTHRGWCITIHPPHIDTFVELVENLVSDDVVNIAVIGDEISGTGGRHGQAFLNFQSGPRGIAFGSLKKMLDDAGIDSAHIEPKKSASMDRAGNYCLKEHFEHIAALFPEKGSVEELYRPGSKPLLCIGWDIENACPEKGKGQGKRTDLDNFKASVLRGECREFDTAMINHSGLCARAERFVRLFIGRYSPIIPMSPEEWHGMLSRGDVRTWQAWAINEFAVQDINYRYRKVHVVTDCKLNGTGGNSGKSHFCDWFPRLAANAGIKVQVLGPGRLADMANQLQSDIDILLIDIPASRSDTLQWSFVEQLKNGRVDNPKYHSCTIVMSKRPVLVLILCNNHPDVRRRPDYVEFTNDNGYPIDGWNRAAPREFTLSADRWVEYRIESGHDVSGVVGFELPRSLNFGPEFSSDNAGDGPVFIKIPEFWREYETRWEESNERWAVNCVIKVRRVDSIAYVTKNHPLAEPIRAYFTSLGWDGEGALVVSLRFTSPNFCDHSTFRSCCLVNGMIPTDDPRGIVLCDSQGRCGRVWFDRYGTLLNVVAIDPRSVKFPWGTFIHGYMIKRKSGGQYIWTWRGLSDFMDVDNMNGIYH